MAFLAVFAVTQGTFFVVVCGLLIIPAVASTAVVRPYRESVCNVVDIIFLLVLVQICFSATGIALNKPDQNFWFITSMFGIGAVIPLVYITVLTSIKDSTQIINSWLKEKSKWIYYSTPSIMPLK